MGVKQLLENIRRNKHVKIMSKQLDSICNKIDEDSNSMLKAIEKLEGKVEYNERIHKQLTLNVFIQYSIKDIIMLYKIFLNCEIDQDKNLIARTIIMHVSELIDDSGKLIGKQFSSFILDHNDPILVQRLNDIRAIYKIIKVDYKRMKIIRNYVSAHKDKDIKKQLEIMNTIDLSEIDIIVVKIELFLMACYDLNKCIFFKYNNPNEMLPVKSRVENIIDETLPKEVFTEYMKNKNTNYNQPKNT